jgi:3-dehydroquinate synthase
MRTIEVSLQDRSYNILIGNGILARAGRILKEVAETPNLVIVSNSKVMQLHGVSLLDSLKRAGFEAKLVRVPDGERFKTLAIVESIYRQLIRFRADRKTLMVAFGGGVIGDMAGFAAATYLRGVPFVQVPTTLLAQIDSAVGGKTGVNLREGKNLVGAFYQPKMVLIDPLVLLTLPRREFASGVFEALKYGIIWDARLFDLIARKHQRFPQEDKAGLERMIAECVAIKAEVVSRDERESQLRMVLNFGHTFGHALEAATGYARYTHGEAVGHGMIMATQLAAKLKKIEPAEAQSIQEVIAGVSHMPSVHDLDWRRVLDHMSSDKKVVRQQLRFIIPRRTGQVEVLQNPPLDVVREVVASYLRMGSKARQC